MLLYHINIGYPLLDKTSKLIEGKANIIPRDNIAKRDFDRLNEFSEPENNYKERVYFHDIEADEFGNSNIRIINPDFNNGEGIGLSLSFNKDNLPYLVQWKQIGEGEYVCGIEPANSYSRGRAIEREDGWVTTAMFVGAEGKNWVLVN